MKTAKQICRKGKNPGIKPEDFSDADTDNNDDTSEWNELH